ncbi:hypothetical protein OUZ56_031201 [Daphnia magna]|uniref:Uncharacterized protein n=1 Tax=Daphnia magna TaxID=35525 RepID=A0ABQ9ZTK5_9CRUS|nr:hypothetical protein OUZ56_031201 [Daphnia magna]
MAQLIIKQPFLWPDAHGRVVKGNSLKWLNFGRLQLEFVKKLQTTPTESQGQQRVFRLILISILESIHVLSISSITVKLDTRCSRLTKVEKWIDIELSVAFMLRKESYLLHGGTGYYKPLRLKTFQGVQLESLFITPNGLS